ncbi:tyrosine-type recombinase/integrase [Actinomycetes bacterium KLBMP 9797]
MREAPKSKAGERTVAIPGPVLDAFRERKAEQDADRKRAGELWQDTGYIFTDELGRPIDPRKDWQDLLVEAGVAPARVHAARHSAATFLLVQGVDKRVVMEIMGWSQESMLKRYQDVVDSLKRDAAKQMEKLLWGKPPKKGKKGGGKGKKKAKQLDATSFQLIMQPVAWPT